MVEEITLSKVIRVCVQCGSDKTTIHHRVRKCGTVYIHQKWCSAERFGKNGWLCGTCYVKTRYHLGLLAPRKTIPTVNQKIRLMQILGQYACVYCRCQLFACLEFGHKNGGGNEDRKRFGYDAPAAMRRYYIQHPEEARQKIEVTCANCNKLKQWKDNEYSNTVVVSLESTSTATSC